MPLSASASLWAEKVLDSLNTKRINTFEQIKDAGFDIKENAKWLQNFYITLAEEN